MPTDPTARRDFLRISGASLAGAAFPTSPAGAQTTPRSSTASANALSNSGIFDVKLFGAIGDGKTIDSPAINRAIDEAAQKHANVRVVDWNSEARSHASWFGADMLHLSPGLPATVLASDPPSSDERDYADAAFAQAMVKGVESFAT